MKRFEMIMANELRQRKCRKNLQLMNINSNFAAKCADSNDFFFNSFY